MVGQNSASRPFSEKGIPYFITRLLQRIQKGRNAVKSRRVLLQQTASFLFYGISGYLLGTVTLPFGLYPCGTALVCAAETYALPACIGACLASFSYPELSGAAFALNVLALFVRAFLSGNRFREPVAQRERLSAVLSLLTGSITVVVGRFQPPFLLKAGAYLLYLPLLTYCMSRIKGELRSKSVLADSALCIGAALMTLAAGKLSFASLFPALIVSSVFILAACRSGPLFGLLLGLLCGVATRSLAFCVSLGIAGFITGFTYCRKKAVALPLFVLTFGAGILAASPAFAYEAFASVLTGTLLYIPFAEFLPRLLPRTMLRSPHGSLPKESRRMEGLSSTLSSVSDLLFNVSDKLRYPPESEIRETVSGILNSFCGKCAMQSNCYSRRLYDSEGVEDIICARLAAGGLKKSDLPDTYAESCLRLEELVSRLNDGYGERINDYFKNNKTEILASEYSAMARLIKYTSQKTHADTTPDKELTARVTEALCGIGVRFSSAAAYGLRGKIVDVYGVHLEGFPCTSAEISSYLSEKCGILLSEPEFIGGGKDRMTMRFTQARKLKLEYARCAGAKGDSAANGDTVSFFESDEDYFYALISDGMGSGRSAALTSRLTAVFIEKLLTSGAHKNVTLELLNNLLLSKSDESFATVDLLEIDLLSGEASFIKAGAAPAYILRSSKLYKIASYTPPAGIIRSFNAENTKFSLEPGDTVLMLSDGIVQSYDEVPWLCEMLSRESTEDPAKLTEKILAKAKKMNVRDDDMTCVAVKVAT